MPTEVDGVRDNFRVEKYLFTEEYFSLHQFARSLNTLRLLTYVQVKNVPL